MNTIPGTFLAAKDPSAPEAFASDARTFDPLRMEIVEDRGNFVYARPKIRVTVQGHSAVWISGNSTVAHAFKVVAHFLQRRNEEDYARGFRLVARPGYSLLAGRNKSDATMFYDPDDQRPLEPYIVLDRGVRSYSETCRYVLAEIRRPRCSRNGWYIPNTPSRRIRFKMASESDFRSFQRRTLWFIVDNTYWEASSAYGQIFTTRVVSQAPVPGYHAPVLTLVKFAKIMQQYMPDDAPFTI